jgi:microcin C transport system permease protein
MAATTFLGRPISPLTHRRLHNFRANRRGFWSLWIFLLFSPVFWPMSLPMIGLCSFGMTEGSLPIFKSYPETTFVDLSTRRSIATGRDRDREKGWMIWPLIPFRYDTINYSLSVPAPHRPRRSIGSARMTRPRSGSPLIYGFHLGAVWSHPDSV